MALPVSRSPSPHDIQLIYEAQSSAYWTGRFTSLSDTYLYTMTSPLTHSASPPPAATSPPPAQRQACLQECTWNSQDMQKRFDEALDQDERARRVFAELEELCMTVEARRSLFEWREEWAKRCGRPGVLPVKPGILERWKW